MDMTALPSLAVLQASESWHKFVVLFLLFRRGYIFKFIRNNINLSRH